MYIYFLFWYTKWYFVMFIKRASYNIVHIQNVKQNEQEISNHLGQNKKKKYTADYYYVWNEADITALFKLYIRRDITFTKNFQNLLFIKIKQQMPIRNLWFTVPRHSFEINIKQKAPRWLDFAKQFYF